MGVGIRGDLRQMRDDDDLMGTRQSGQPATDLHRRAPTDTGVDLVEHHRGAFRRCRQHHLQRQHHAGQLTAGRTLGQRQQFGAAVRGEPELDRVDPVVPGVCGHTAGQRDRRRIIGTGHQRLHRDPEIGPRHRQAGQLGGDRLGQPLGGLGAGLGEIGGRGHHLGL